MVWNKKENLYFMNSDFFGNIREYIIPRRSLVTNHTKYNEESLFFIISVILFLSVFIYVSNVYVMVTG